MEDGTLGELPDSCTAVVLSGTGLFEEAVQGITEVIV